MLRNSLSLLFLLCSLASLATKKDSTFYPAGHASVAYTGRTDLSDPVKPKFWAPGVYITLDFYGTYCVLLINDEELWGKSHNYIQVIIDGEINYRVKTGSKQNRVVLATGLKKEKHRIIICKDTEAGIGYLQPTGFICEKLLPLPVMPVRKIEFIGNSITCGMGIDESLVPCGKGEWYDQHSAWLAYGPLSARKLNAQWQLSSVSGIGLIHSCCEHKTVMPQLFDKVNMAADSIAWDFSRYQPDLVTVCLGQNDGIQDSAQFCSAYVQFITRLQQYYPTANIVLLNSPMAGPDLDSVLKCYVTAVEAVVKKNNNRNITHYFFSKRFYKGCSSHPGKAEHEEMSEELTGFIKGVMKW